jgi:hypothetical protein
MAGNLPEWAAQEAMNYLKQRLNGHGGIIVLNAQGQVWDRAQYTADGLGL